MDKPLVILVGPTAVGKTEASIVLAKALNGEIISGDSMQVFKGLDIGTAKIKPQEMDDIVHHLIDIKEPWENFSVAEFKSLVDNKIADIHNRGKIPILVGGTGFYVNSIIYDYHFSNSENDISYRNELMALAEEKGNGVLVERLQEVDPKSAARLHFNDTKRLVRALEVYHVTGKPMSENDHGIDRNNPRYPIVYLALNMDREVLYDRINHRVDVMIDDGWVNEVSHLLDSGVSPESLALKGLGYRQLVSYLQGEYTLERAVELIKRDTRHFAKRQLTWFRNDPNIIWVNKDGKNSDEVNNELLEATRRTIAMFVE